MKCYRCGSETLFLAHLNAYERKEYLSMGIRMLFCLNCGLDQNHQGDDDPEPVDSMKEPNHGNDN